MGKIISRLRHSGERNFAILEERDGKFSHVLVNTLVERDAIPEWARMPKMEVKVIETGLTYELGLNTTILGQVWTVVNGGNFVPLSSAGQPLGYVPLDSEGKIDSQYLGALFINNSTTVADQAAMLALTTIQGDLITVASEGQSYYKLNNNDPSQLSDFQQILNGAAVQSVNGQVGVVNITIASLLLVGANVTAFNNAVTSNPIFNEIDSNFTEIYQAINQLAAGEGIDLSNYYTKSDVNTALGTKVDKEDGKGLSTEDYTTDEKGKLEGIDEGATRNEVATSAEHISGVLDDKVTTPKSSLDATKAWLGEGLEWNTTTNKIHNIHSPKLFGVRLNNGDLKYFDGGTAAMTYAYDNQGLAPVIFLNGNIDSLPFPVQFGVILDLNGFRLGEATIDMEGNIVGNGTLGKLTLNAVQNITIEANIISNESGAALTVLNPCIVNIMGNVIGVDKAIEFNTVFSFIKVYGNVIAGTGPALEGQLAEVHGNVISNSTDSPVIRVNTDNFPFEEPSLEHDFPNTIIYGSVINTNPDTTANIIELDAYQDLTVQGGIFQRGSGYGISIRRAPYGFRNSRLNFLGPKLLQGGVDPIGHQDQAPITLDITYVENKEYPIYIKRDTTEDYLFTVPKNMRILSVEPQGTQTVTLNNYTMGDIILKYTDLSISVSEPGLVTLNVKEE